MSRFEKDNNAQEFKVYSIVKDIITENPDKDYYSINDLVHDMLKPIFGYTHDLRKAYQDDIKYIFNKSGKALPQ